MHEFAQLNPQFGVHFPMGKRDKPHMEPRATTEKKVQVVVLGAVRRQVSPCTTMRIAERRIDAAPERSPHPERNDRNLVSTTDGHCPADVVGRLREDDRVGRLECNPGGRVGVLTAHRLQVATRLPKAVKSSAIAASVELRFGRSSRARFISARSSNAMLEKE